MWTISGIKTKARERIRLYFWDALMVCIIVGLFSAGSGGAAGSTESFYQVSSTDLGGVREEIMNSIAVSDSLSEIPQRIVSALSREEVLFLSVLASIAAISVMVSLAIGIFVKPAFTIGKNRFFAESSANNRSAGIGRLLWGFKHNYLNGIWVMFVMNLFITLGMICFVIPGIYLTYSYLMVPYILAENPDMRARDALRLSKNMMKGNKFRTFLLELSFIGWRFLAALAGLFTCGIGSCLVEPYVEAAYAELYLELRKPYRELNEFRRNGGAGDAEKQDTERNAYAGSGEGSGASYHAEGGGYADRGYYQRTDGWTDVRETSESVAPPEENERGKEVKRSEGGPGRGYYLNGVFYPYTEDELRELGENEKR